MSDYGIKTYADLAETCGNMVLANEMAKRPLELVRWRAQTWCKSVLRSVAASPDVTPS